MIVFRLLFLGMLLLLTGGDASDQECTKGFPFACFVHSWEKDANAGKEFIHAFNTETFFDVHCKDVEKCNTDCPTAAIRVDKSDIKNRGVVFKCNPKNLFCSEKKEEECIPIRKVYRLSERESSSQIETTQELLRTKRGANRQLGQERANAVKMAAKGAFVSDEESFVPNLVEIQTIVLPICRREDTEKDCMALTRGRFCTRKEAFVEYQAHDYLPWKDIKDICTIVESPLGSQSPKWFAKHVENGNDILEPMKVVWEYTGFPFSIVTNKNSPFLAYRHDYGVNSCKKYAGNTESCLPLPICDDGNRFITYNIRMKNVLNPNEGYLVEEGNSECERACESWEEPTLHNQCRVLDIEHLPLDRQNSPPYAKFATLLDNLQRRKFDLNDTIEAATHKDTKRVLIKRSPTANSITPIRYYGRPINLKTVDEADYADIESNYWLSSKRNPFYKKYGDKVKLVNASKCACNAKNTFCRSNPECHKKSHLSWWALLLIVVACIAIIGVSAWTFGYLVITAVRRARMTGQSTTEAEDGPTKEGHSITALGGDHSTMNAAGGGHGTNVLNGSMIAGNAKPTMTAIGGLSGVPEEKSNVMAVRGSKILENPLLAKRPSAAISTYVATPGQATTAGAQSTYFPLVDWVEQSPILAKAHSKGPAVSTYVTAPVEATKTKSDGADTDSIPQIQ